MDKDPTTETRTEIVNLDYLKQVTDGNSDSLKEMLEIYLKQTPQLIEGMKDGASKNNWELTRASVHSLIPSFFVMGFDPHYEQVARTIQQNAIQKKDLEQTAKMVDEIADICSRACDEIRKVIAAL
jgi:HPt (histidine-containing phosphotransfer) domain-containing protein